MSLIVEACALYSGNLEKRKDLKKGNFCWAVNIPTNWNSLSPGWYILRSCDMNRSNPISHVYFKIASGFRFCENMFYWLCKSNDRYYIVKQLYICKRTNCFKSLFLGSFVRHSVLSISVLNHGSGNFYQITSFITTCISLTWSFLKMSFRDLLQRPWGSVPRKFWVILVLERNPFFPSGSLGHKVTTYSLLILSTLHFNTVLVSFLSIW